MSAVKQWILGFGAVVMVGCAGQPEALKVKQFYLRDEKYDSGVDPMVRAEKQRLLYGAVSMEERRDRLGQYYTALWNDAGSGPVDVIFEFQQGVTASKIKRRTKSFPADSTSGKAVFSVIGDDYFKSGKVLSWKISLKRNGKTIATQQSFLWK
ncbi:hypothetical protein JIN85_14900 [Luteolibacter pohnpeiensis]|uniref:Lipoprotein n=1 Tax=Luteolibacter pohnpeiensis TaxID=454153 RepID=A0A934SD60_9BACT|nr:hypothetical protein [Luteolibacter pohnpeiensis]MBK1883704.1 hypothetical protein [Luteolibacter pohnpeiensis]